jgi:hypothetical protein
MATDANDLPTGDEFVTEEEVDDAFRELLEGLRTTLPGTTALFGFLLIVPFQGEFSTFDTVTRVTYYTSFLAAATAAALLIAPAVHHRLRAPLSGARRRSTRHLRITVWVTILGTVAFAVALATGVVLVSRIVFSSTVASVAAGAVIGALVITWFYLPLVTFERLD